MPYGMSRKTRLISEIFSKDKLGDDLNLEENNAHARTAANALASMGLLSLIAGPQIAPIAAGLTIGTVFHAGKTWVHKKRHRLSPEEISAILKYIDHIIHSVPISGNL